MKWKGKRKKKCLSVGLVDDEWLYIYTTHKVKRVSTIKKGAG